MAAVPCSLEEAASSSFGITKRMVSFGRGSLPEFVDNTQVEIHWESRFADDEEINLDHHHNHNHSHDGCCPSSSSNTRKVLDDTRKIFGPSRPMSLILGRSFRLPLLESCVKTMCPGEVAEFLVTAPDLISAYPAFAASLRSIAEQKPSRGHCCAGMQTSSVGYPDLDEIITSKGKRKLAFTIELVGVHQPGTYSKEKWQMSDDDRLESLEKYHKQGNELVRLKEYRAAAATYSEALEHLEVLCSRDKPGEPEWKEVDDRRIVFYLNLAQCQLHLEDYLGAIESCSQVLRRDHENVKALFRRAKAYAKIWEEDKAFNDWAEVCRLDRGLMGVVMKESNDFRQQLELHRRAEAERLRTGFSKK